MKFKKSICGCFFALVQLVVAAGCTSSPSKLPYPAFIDVNELDSIFMAGLPGVRAKQLAGDPNSRRTSNRVSIPADWEFTTGASPTQSVELYVLAGQIILGEFQLTPGGYAYLPSGSSGLQMRSDNGAVILYFLDARNPDAVIQTPLITNSELVSWLPDANGAMTKELRLDPGSGARTWLLRIDSGSTTRWQKSSRTLEGYLLSGSVSMSECLGEKVVTAEYQPGGYFYRPPDSISGGPAEAPTEVSVWLLREDGTASTEIVSGCVEVVQ